MQSIKKKVLCVQGAGSDTQIQMFKNRLTLKVVQVITGYSIHKMAKTMWTDVNFFVLSIWGCFSWVRLDLFSSS